MVARFCQGFVLAGGRSTRMGDDKALLKFGDQTLVELMAHNVNKGVESVIVVGSRQKYGPLGMPVIEDLHPGLGPLGGIHAALKHSTKPLCLIVGCDMPFLNGKFLEFLVQVAIVADAEVTIAESMEYGYESLCAVYSKSVLPQVEAAIANNDLKLSNLYGKVKLRTLSAEECRPHNQHGLLFSNINTTEDLEAARRRMDLLATPA